MGFCVAGEVGADADGAASSDSAQMAEVMGVVFILEYTTAFVGKCRVYFGVYGVVVCEWVVGQLLLQFLKMGPRSGSGWGLCARLRGE